MWQILNNGIPAEYKEGEHKYWKHWKNSKFETLEEAVVYLQKMGWGCF